MVLSVVGAMNREGVEYLTFGAIALWVHGIVRNTEDTDFYIDFLSRLGEAYQYSTLEWQMAEIDGVPIRVVTPAQLFRMKRDTVRPKDRIDAEALRQVFGLTGD